MSLWRQFIGGVRVLVKREAADRDIGDELNHFLEEATASLMAKGLTAEEARRTARLEFGTVTAIREEVRTFGWEDMVDSFFTDLRYAARRLRGKPGFTAVSILTLGLGISATTAIFTVTESVLLKPLPYPHSEQLVALTHTAPGVKINELGLAASLYYTYAEENRVFQDVAMWQPDGWSVTGLQEPEQVRGISVTHGFFAALGVQPAMGRDFSAADENPNAERVVILSDGYWRGRLGGDRSVLGRRILLDGNASTVVGVLPRSFAFMDQKIAMIQPERLNRANTLLISFCCQGIARLKPGVTLAQANADIARMLPMAPVKFPMNPGMVASAFTDARFAPQLRLLKDSLIGDIGNTLWVLMGAVGLVLWIACANVANLLLVRADGRRQELAIRTALGADGWRIARELLIESMLLGTVGGAIGTALAAGAIRVLVASNLPNLPRLQDISVDFTVLAFAVCMSLGAGFLFGLIPVLRYARPRVSGTLRDGSRSFTAGRERHRARSMLVMVQVALAMVLLVSSGLMVRTFRALHLVEPGFSAPGEVESARVFIPDTQVKDPERVVRMQEEILRKIEAITGVRKAAMISVLPLDGGSTNPVFVEDQPQHQFATPPLRRFKFISPGYISSIGSGLIAGRDLNWTELYAKSSVALVSENMARELWQDPRAAVGKRIRASITDPWREVIGVVADLRDNGIDQKAPGIVYWPLLQQATNGRTTVTRSLAYVIRTPRAGSAALRREIQQAVAEVNASLPLADVKTLESAYERSLARTTFTVVLLAVAGFMALILGVVGIYGVVSYSVSQRTREVGIRIALGASLRQVTGLFLGHSLVISGIGAVCGLGVALALTRAMKSLLFEVSPADPVTYVAASAGLIVAVLFGSYLPVRRATRVDPVEALRNE